MAALTELLHFGLLNRQNYQECLQKFLSNKEIDIRKCEALTSLIEAWGHKKDCSLIVDVSLQETYVELFQSCLFPHLIAIIVDEAKSPNHFGNFKLGENCIEGKSHETKWLPFSPSASKLSCQNSSESVKFSLDFERKTVEVNEVVLASKIIDLIIVVLKELIVSDGGKINCQVKSSGELHTSLQKVYSFVGELFDLLGKSLHECGCEILSKCDLHRIKFLSLIFTNFVMDNDWMYSSSGLKNNLKSVVREALTIIHLSHDVDVTALLLNLVVHPFIVTFPEELSNVVYSLWDIVLKFYVFKDGYVTEETKSSGFLILCFMAEYIFNLESLCGIRNNDRFFAVIQFGLIHVDSLTRKRSQFILKRAVDFCISSEFRSTSSKFFSWNDANSLSLQNTWNDFFLLCETLEEKQSHVIKPVLDKVDKLVETVDTRQFHVSWLLVIIKRVFDHDNRNIKYWGVMKVLKLKLMDFILVDGLLAFVNSHLLTVLGDYSLYGQELSQSPHGTISSLGEEFGAFLVRIVDGIDSGLLQSFMHSILESIFDSRTWGGIPLFYVVRGLSVIPDTHVWDYSIVKEAIIRFEGCLSTQEVAIRSASQCSFLRAVLKHLNREATLVEVCSIVRHFRRKESWSRGTVIWKSLMESINKFEENYKSNSGRTSVEDAFSLSLKPGNEVDMIIPPQDAALGLCLLIEKSLTMECEAESKRSIEILTHPIRRFLSDCHMRPYLDQQRYFWLLRVLVYMLEIFNDVPDNSSDTDDIAGISFMGMSESFASIIHLFTIHVRGFDHLSNLEKLSIYLDLFAQLHQTPSLSKFIVSQYGEIIPLCEKLLNDGDFGKFSHGIVLLEFLLTYCFDQSAIHMKQKIAQLTISKVLISVVEITGKRQAEGFVAAKSSIKLQMEVTRSCWSCVELLVKKTASLTNEDQLHLREDVEVKSLSILTEAIFIAGRINVLSVFKTCEELVPIIIREGVWHTVVELLWKASCEFKKCCDLYRSLVKCICSVLYHHQILLKVEYSNTMNKISEKLLDTVEGVQGIAGHMARSLLRSLLLIAQDESLLVSSCGSALNLLVTLGRFGVIFRKQQKLIRDTTDYIQNCSELYSTKLLLEIVESDQQVRAVVFRFYLSLDRTQPQDRAVATVIFQSMKKQYAQCSGDRRDFANSQKHRYKTRLLQAFMILLPLLSEEECSNAMDWLCLGLIREQQQPSVHYMQEWGIALLVIYHPSLFPLFFKLFVQGTKERVGCVGSFLASLTHIACTSEDPSVLRQAIQYTLPWCMAQHFNTRLYAQVSLRKIWHHCENKNVTEILNEYMAVQHCLQFVAEQGSAMRNTLNMLNDFYFRVFHPTQHYTLETILCDLPRLSLLSDDEWLTVESLLEVMDVKILPINSDLPLHNDDMVLTESVPAPWVVKAAGETSPFEDKDDIENERSVVQKKMTPWKCMMPELACTLGLPHQKSANQKKGDLIVVASLIDKAPNLGGLCRTCEVFSVKEYVVPSLAVQEDHNFNSLSLTAQQWVPMKEVKPEDLPAYLRALQSNGYTLVAAEQTANSKSLSEFKFPERTVVVLGNEREGIPCDLLQLLDVCVEIPQTGIIRSLNVHVSGALFVWEYTRQHMNKVEKS